MQTDSSSLAEKLAEQLESMAKGISESLIKTASDKTSELDPTHTLNFLKFFTSRQQ